MSFSKTREEAARERAYWIKGRVVEQAVAWWLEGRYGLHVLHVGLLAAKSSQWTDLIGFGGTGYLSGPLRLIEIKSKRDATKTRCRNNRLESGFSLKHWQRYGQLRKTTGLEVFVMQAIDLRDLITCDPYYRLDVPETAPGGFKRVETQSLDTHRRSRSDGSTIMWPIDQLTAIGAYSELRAKITRIWGAASEDDYCAAVAGLPQDEADEIKRMRSQMRRPSRGRR
jgi:hypothetical protein